jgi:SsrA-binding protein
MTERKLVCKNRRARFNYHIEETYEAGLALLGSEVKSLREGRANLSDSYARLRGSELYLVKAHISPYEAAREGHEPERERKLLMRKGEIARLGVKLRERGYTLVPLELYFSGSYAKVELGLARGKRAYDKRHAIAKRESDRSLRKITKQRRQGRRPQ